MILRHAGVRLWLVAMVCTGLLVPATVASAAISTSDLRLLVRAEDDPSVTSLAGSTVDGSIRFVIRPEHQVKRVVFKLDGATIADDRSAPFYVPVDTTKVADGSHSAVTAVTASDGSNHTLRANFTVANKAAAVPTSDLRLLVRAEDDPSVTSLAGSTVDGSIRFVIRPEHQVKRVVFKLDGATIADDRSAPFYVPVDTTKVADGSHSAVAAVTASDGSNHTLRATFTVNNGNAVTAPAPDPAPAPTPTTEPAPVATTQLGLHVTTGELSAWRARMKQGPYKAKGDVSSNSPGDWDRIVRYAGNFMAKPSAGRWAGPTKNNPNGCVLPGQKGTDWGYEPPVQEASQLRDAAFYAMVANSAKHAAAVKSELLAQAKVPGVNFNSRSRWCLGKIYDGNPGFMVATWLTKQLYAVDYLRIHNPNIFSAEEMRMLDSWFAAAATWMAHDVDVELGELFVDRKSGNYALTSTAKRDTGEIAYYGGPKVYVLQRRYNNRMARLSRFVALVGVAQNNASFKSHGERFVTEFLRFSYYPQGAVGDFERWSESEPIKGWKYANETVGAMLTIADHLARAGDDGLYRYSTTQGGLGTQGSHHSGQPKSLRTLVEDLMRYVDGTYKRYGTDRADRNGKAAYKIDSINDLNGDARLNDLQVVMGNGVHESSYVRSVYTRVAPGAPAYPANPRDGSGDVEGGEAGTYPGALFMFGELEHLHPR